MNYKQRYLIRQQLFLLFLLISSISYGQQEVIRLYKGTAPSSECWNWKEQVIDTNSSKSKIVYNVVEPTLTMFPAEGAVNTGTSVIIAPGGGLFTLSMDSEGFDVAKWLSQKGVTAFVLKYRLVHITGDPSKAFISALGSGKIDSITRRIVPLAMNDGLAAVAHVRKNAAQYNINPARIGFMGFSAGGGVAMSVAYNAAADSRPSFVAPIYAWNKSISGNTVPLEKMPAFIVVASDDPLNLVPTSIDIYNKWKAANQKAQLIVYQNGGHGFGMGKQNKLSDTWINRFEEWLEANGLLKQE